MPVSGLPPRIETVFLNLFDNLKYAKDYLEIPVWSEFSTTGRVAWTDSVRAVGSVSAFFKLSTRPLWILLSVLTRYLCIFLEIVARHTFHHGFVAMGKGYGQAKIATREFVKFQRGLSRFWVLVELCAVAVMVLLYLLRRLIIRRKYVERVAAWYRGKKNKLIQRYYDMVDQVAETSMTMALLMPHLIFGGGFLAMKVMLPSVLRYFANGTYVTEIISLWIPVFRTVRLISVKQSESKTPKSRTTENNGIAAKGSVAARWLNATSPGANSSQDKTADKDKRKSTKADVETEASMLLRYWVVYGLLYSLMKAICLIPFIGPYFTISAASVSSASASSASEAAAASSYWFLSTKWLAYFIPTPFLFYELRLVFFVWLRYLPRSVAAQNIENEPKSSQTSRRRKARYDYLILSPADMIYKKVAPIAVHLADKSNAVASSAASRTNKNNNTNNVSTIASIGHKLSSILDLAVMLKMVSAVNKERLVNLVSESYALLPACVTLFMPSRFTSYGCIYASAVIPAANSANCETSLGSQGLLKGTVAYKNARDERTLYLKYWVMNALFQLVLDFVLYTFLQWVPLSTHVTLLVWIALNMPWLCRKAYEYLEYEMVTFGVLDMEHVENYDVEKTLTVRLVKKLSSILPKAVDDSEDVDSSKNVADNSNKIIKSFDTTDTKTQIGESSSSLDGKEDTNNAPDSSAPLSSSSKIPNESDQSPPDVLPANTLDDESSSPSSSGGSPNIAPAKSDDPSAHLLTTTEDEAQPSLVENNADTSKVLQDKVETTVLEDDDNNDKSSNQKES